MIYWYLYVTLIHRLLNSNSEGNFGKHKDVGVRPTMRNICAYSILLNIPHLTTLYDDSWDVTQSMRPKVVLPNNQLAIQLFGFAKIFTDLPTSVQFPCPPSGPISSWARQVYLVASDTPKLSTISLDTAITGTPVSSFLRPATTENRSSRVPVKSLSFGVKFAPSVSVSDFMSDRLLLAGASMMAGNSWSSSATLVPKYFIASVSGR